MKQKFKHIYTLACMYICAICYSQNYIPNPSFEPHFDCIFNGIESTSPWCGINSVGYLNSCMTPTMGVPTQYWTASYPSHQVPHCGNAYATFGYIYPTQPTAMPRYPHIKLIDTLQSGKIYCVTYYVSLWNDCKYSADKFGALFTSTPFNCTVTNQTLTTGYIPQVVSTPGVLYDDTLNWMEVSGTFTAIGNEAYLTIGNFFFNAAHTYSISYPGGVRNLAEYYLDDVSVEEVQAVVCRNDTNIVLGDSVIIGANLGEANLYNWQPTAGLSCTNCPNPKASPSVTTTYTVTKTQCKSTTTDVITITVSPTGINDIGFLNEVVGVSPNPTNNIITITSRFDFEKVDLLSITGQVLIHENVNANNLTLTTNNLSNGIYFVKVVYPNGLSVTKKIVKQ